MRRLGELDLPDKLAPQVSPWVTSFVVGFAAAAVAWTVRALLEAIAPGVAAYALIFPAVTIATLFARWPAGLTTALVAVPYAWFFIYPTRATYAVGTTSSVVNLISICLAISLTIICADLFQRTARRATAERDAELARQDLFLAEVEHRVKNNFALVGSLLELQRRRARTPETESALAAAQSRVESIARAHRHLYREGVGTVDMATYLEELCSALSEALFLRGAILLRCQVDPVALPRDRAVSLGLVVNELVTNAAKHAFAHRDRGTIHVRLELRPGGGCVLRVSDDGVGMPGEPVVSPDGGLGQRLIDAFARQAGGTIAVESGPGGTTVTMDLPDLT